MHTNMTKKIDVTQLFSAWAATRLLVIPADCVSLTPASSVAGVERALLLLTPSPRRLIYLLAELLAGLPNGLFPPLARFPSSHDVCCPFSDLRLRTRETRALLFFQEIEPDQQVNALTRPIAFAFIGLGRFYLQRPLHP